MWAAGVCIFFAASPMAWGKLFELETSVGYEYNNNVIYSEIATEEGADYLTSGALSIAITPFSSDLFSIKMGGNINFNDYQKRSDFNTHGQSADLTLMCHPLGPNYLYLVLDTSAYAIGEQTNYSRKASSVQYIFDITASSRFWTTLFLDRADETYSDPTYKPLAGPSTTLGIKQNLADWLYLLAKSVDYKAEEEDFSYKETSGTIGVAGVAAPWFRISGAVSAGETKYKEPWSVLPVKKREDAYVSGFLALSRDIAANLSLEIEYSYMNNRCNLKVEETRQGYASYNQSALKAMLAFKI